MVIKTFNKQGLNAQPAEITTSSLAAAEFLLPTAKGKKVYVIGEQPLMDALAAKGMLPFGGPDDGGKGKVEIGEETMSEAGLVPPPIRWRQWWWAQTRSSITIRSRRRPHTSSAIRRPCSW